jgi:hypothetical protein
MAIEHHDLPESAIHEENDAIESEEEKNETMNKAHFDAVVPTLTFSKKDKASVGLARRMKKWFKELLSKC